MSDLKTVVDDLASKFGENAKLTVTTEHPDERTARLEKDRLDDIELRAHNRLLRRCGVFGVMAMLAVSTAVAILATGELARWGMSIATTLGGACGGFALGRPKDK